MDKFDNMQEKAAHLHKNVPPDWYVRALKENIFLRFWHTSRFKEVGKLIESSGGKILDIGCADGAFTRTILDKSKANQIIGIDVLKSSVDWANKHWKNKKMKFLLGDAHCLKFKNQTFDAVFSLESLEHVLEPLKVLQEVHRVTKKGGYIIILVPSENFLFQFAWWLRRKFLAKDIWEHTHLHNYSNGFLEELLERAGFTIKTNKKFLLSMLHVVKAVKN